VKEGLKIIPVSHVREVLAQALVRQPEPVDWDEAAEEAAAAARKDREGEGARTQPDRALTEDGEED
jgi:ATP-dependent Lon protease